MTQLDLVRRHEIISLTRSQVEEIVSFAFPCKGLVSYKPMIGGLCNTNYKIFVTDYSVPFLLRIYSGGSKICNKERKIHELVKGNIPVPEIFFSSDDGNIVPYSFSILEWIEGVSLNSLFSQCLPEELSKIGYDTGLLLAEIGTFQFDFSGFFGSNLEIEKPLTTHQDAVMPYVNHYLSEKKVSELLGKELTSRLLEAVTELAPLATELIDCRSLIHADFKGENILFRYSSESWVPSAVLDWEWAHSGSPLFDVGTMFRHEAEIDPIFYLRFEEGFQEGGGYLPTYWKEISKVWDSLSLLELLSSTLGRASSVRKIRRLLLNSILLWEGKSIDHS